MRRSVIRLLALLGCTLVLAGFGLLYFGSATVPVQAQDSPADYVGSKECASCHRALARDHADSNHTLALQEVGRKKEEILADFTQGEDVRLVQFPGEDAPRAFTADDIDLVVGAGVHAQRYLYKIKANDYMVLPAEWNVTTQAWQPLKLGADETWPAPAYDWEQNCAGCHTTGYDASRGRWQDIGVQCEACHGPASNHVELAKDAGRNPSDDELTAIRSAIYRSPDPQVCGQCHSQGSDADNHPFPVGYTPGATLTDFFTLVTNDSADHWWVTGHASQQNMQYNEWLTSNHSKALSELQTSTSATDTCLTCHSEDARQTAVLMAQVESGDRDGSPPEALTVASAKWGVTCTTCHQEHADTDQPFELVQAANDLCIGCHSQPESDADLHHPVVEMFEGTALVAGIDGVAGKHFSEENGPRCITCHMQALPVSDSTTRASHGFTPILPGDSETVPSACAGCHTDLTTTDLSLLVKNTQDAVRTRLTADEMKLASVSTLKTDARYLQAMAALDFIKGDGSFGIHNYTYTDALLTSAEQDLALLTGSVTPTATFAPTVTPPSQVVFVEPNAASSEVTSGVRPITVIVIGFVVAVLLIAAFAFFRNGMSRSRSG